MSVHVYSEDTRIVLMSWVRIVERRNELRHMELSLPVAEMLLSKLSERQNELRLDATQLLDLLRGRGQVASPATLEGSEEKIRRTLVALANVALHSNVLHSVDEIDDESVDESLDAFAASFVVNNEETEGLR